MAGANSNIQLTSLDFNTLKSNFITYLRSQDTLKDYNFEGSGLSVLTDILAYNTQYNAYYLNQVANEMFLDSSIQRASVVSHAKLLNYTPKSAIAPTAEVQVVITDVAAEDTSLTLSAYSPFLSATINSINYNFINTDSYTVNVVNGTATFPNVKIKQGVRSNYAYTVNNTVNPSLTFEIPDETVDNTTIRVLVQQAASNSSYEVYNLATNLLSLDGTSKVYFLQESLKGTYEIYFGDGVIGKKLVDGNIVNIAYLSTEGSAAEGANSFILMDTIGGYSPSAVNSILPATQGGDKESIDSIKLQAPKTYSAQNRAVNKNDYIVALQQNTLGISFDAVNVWGGEENSTPVYGQVFVCLKPTGGYRLTDTQKSQIIEEVIKPISVVTVAPTIVDPDYTYLKLVVDVLYDPKKTSATASQIQTGVKAAIQTFATNTLNTFNSTFNTYDLLNTIQNYNPAIITSEFNLRMEKKFLPNLTSTTSYKLYYNSPLEKNMFTSGVSSLPGMKFLDQANLTTVIDEVFIEEVPSETHGVESISVLNPGFNYQYAPTVTIRGDGTGATAHAVIINGAIASIIVDSAGTGYTSATAVISAQPGDTSGTNGAAVVNLAGRYGTLRTYYNDSTNVKTILNSNAGTIDYQEGVITLVSFSPYDVNNALGELSVSIKPTTSIISSDYNRIITIDPYDTTAVVVNVTAKNS